MNFQEDAPAQQNVTAYGEGWIAVNGEKIEHSIVLDSRGARAPWPVAHYEDLVEESFAQLVQRKPELVVFGSGGVLRFPAAAWLRPIVRAGIGLETMDLHAACRTYNILAAEGRHVVLAALIER